MPALLCNHVSNLHDSHIVKKQPEIERVFYINHVDAGKNKNATSIPLAHLPKAHTN